MPKENPTTSPSAKMPEAKKDGSWFPKRRLPPMSHPRFDIAPGDTDGTSISRIVGVC